MGTKKILASVIAGTVGMAVTMGAAAMESDNSMNMNMSDQSMDKRFYIAPMISYGFFGDDTIIKGPQGQEATLDREDSIGGTLAIGKPINQWLNLELYGFYFNPDQEIGVSDAGSLTGDYKTGSGEIWGIGVDALLFPARDTLPVYGLLGVALGEHAVNQPSLSGGAVTTTEDDEFAKFVDVGLGYVYPITDYGIAIRAEYRFRYARVDSSGTFAGLEVEDAEFTNHIVSLGLQIPLGAPSSEPVDMEPAPMPEPDPVDSDNDGVLDVNDLCPNTMAGAQVNAKGCRIQNEPEPVELQGVTFQFDESSLTNQAERRLRSVIAALRAAPEIEFRLDGYTDAIGTEQYNMGLSKRRVDSVREYLVTNGVSPMRITATEGHGENNPVAPNSTERGRAQNRRVEITVTEGPAR